MTDTPTPPPHLLKKFSAEARAESSKRNGAGYMKTFARLCIEWANSKSSPNSVQIRSSDIVPPPELVQQWTDKIYGGPGVVAASDDICLAKLATQWGADKELEACVEWISQQDWTWTSAQLRAARRPKPLSLKEEALAALHGIDDQGPTPEQVVTIRRALEDLPDD